MNHKSTQIHTGLLAGYASVSGVSREQIRVFLSTTQRKETTGTNKTNGTIFVVVFFYAEGRAGGTGFVPSVPMRRVGTRALPCVAFLGRVALRRDRIAGVGCRAGGISTRRTDATKRVPPVSPVLRGYVFARFADMPDVTVFGKKTLIKEGKKAKIVFP